MDETEKKGEETNANAGNNNDKVQSLKFKMKDQKDKTSKQLETICQLESEVGKLKNRSLRKTLRHKSIKYHQAKENC